MLIYSKTIVSFIKRLKAHYREILSAEVGLRVLRERFEFEGYRLHMDVVCFEDPALLGWFRPEHYQIGINRTLLYKVDDEFIKNVLRHEIAHYLAFIKYGRTINDHGPEYRELCRSYGWGEEVFSAKSELPIQEIKKENAQDANVLAKVKKLLNLASSTNTHEAELATVKANELLIRHNLSMSSYEDDGAMEEEYCVQVVASSPRNNAKLHALYEIMENFFVQPVFSKGKGLVNLEVVGTKINVELADYVAKFLWNEFDANWKKAQALDPKLKGASKKNSFIKGIAKGFCTKLKSSQSQISSKKDLIVLKYSLQRAINMAYSKLSTTSSTTRSSCAHSENLGLQAGQNLSIRPGIGKKSSSILRLGFKK